MQPVAGLVRADRWITGWWMVLFAWLYLNPFVAFDTHIGLTVPLLATLSGMLTARAGRASIGALPGIVCWHDGSWNGECGS